jgi:5-methylcytosine-specific restriction endonuclease McrA
MMAARGLIERTRGGACAKCFAEGKSNHVDHKHPDTRDNTLENLQLLCVDCHREVSLPETLLASARVLLDSCCKPQS